MKIPFVLLLAAASSVMIGCGETGKKNQAENRYQKRPESPVIRKTEHYVTDSTKPEILYESKEFDQEGHCVRHIRYQAKDTMEFDARFTPNEDGNPVKTVTTYLDGSTDTESHTYSGKKAVKTEWVRSDGTRGRHEYRYDDRDSLVQWDRFQNGKYLITQLWPNRYDDNGQVLESWYKETNNGRDTSTQSHWQYRYDSVGRLTHRVTLSGYALQSAEEFYYDTSGGRIMTIEYALDTLRPGTYIPQKRIVNTFNEYGELTVSRTLDAEGKELDRVENVYDKYGNLTQSVTTWFQEGVAITQKHRWVYTFY